jgi:8-oxo-dGTP pyrophosphatase MutT (NUDIX family)
MRKWTVRSTRTLLQRPPWLRVEEQDVELLNGQTIEGYLLTPIPEVCMVFALTRDQRVLFVEQYKHGAGTTMWDLPAGYLDEDEAPLTCAQRELEEETGYLAEDWRYLGGWLIDPNRTAARFHYFLALDAEPDDQQHLDVTEEIEIHRVPLSDLSSVLTAGRVESLASLAGITTGLAVLKST